MSISASAAQPPEAAGRSDSHTVPPCCALAPSRHFFEPRYRQLLRIAMQTDRMFLWAASGRLGPG